MKILLSLVDQLEELTDPRVEGRVRYNLTDILVITCLAILCGQESWYEIVDFAKARETWLKKYLKLEHGVPSHDTFGRIFALIDPKELERIFINWINGIRGHKGLKTICIDGKTVKGTVKTKLGRRRDCLHLVNAYSVEDDLVIGQIKSNGSGNVEVTAAKKLIDFFNLKEALVLADAGVGRASFAKEVTDKGGHYLFPIKGNTKAVHEGVKGYFSPQIEESFLQENKRHGRLEIRKAWVEHDKSQLRKLNTNNRTGKTVFPKVKTFGKIEYTFCSKENRPYIQSGITHEKRIAKYEMTDNEVREKKFVKYFVSDLKISAKQLIEKSKLEWLIENKLHWLLDVSFREDAWRTRDKTSAQNLSVIRKICLNLAKKETTSTLSMKSKLKKAAYDGDYLETLLFGE